ncbi:non-ribosomal peptide synthetase [Paenibacillus assamensis]|uniref:non-ribosomal peptide synthetase n=1 Tax=Paenibacillus assamensis TaxID=311244 RepID=UPI0003FC712E|nr:non-ribosomal peptide synthetase [Paenibacillus assamensis]
MSTKLEIQNIYPCTPLQEGMLFHSLLDQQSQAYFEQTTFHLSGSLNIKWLERSFNELIERHDILRTNFIHEKTKTPQQVVLKKRQLQVQTKDLSGFGEEMKQWKLEEFKRKDKEYGFDLSRELLVRISVLKLDELRSVLIWSHHHVLMDGWCIGIIMKELMQLYQACGDNRLAELEKPVPYRRFVEWLDKQDREQSKHFWRDYLAGYEQLAALPRKTEALSTNNGAAQQEEVSFRLTVEQTSGLQQLASSQRVTLNTVIQALWGALLQYYNRSDDVVFGSVVSGRPSDILGIEHMVGLFINTVPVRVQGRAKSFAALLHEVQAASAASESHHYYPLYDIQAESLLKHRLINHIVAFENYPISEQIEESNQGTDTGFIIDDIEVFEQTSYDLTVAIGPGTSLFVKMSFNPQVYERVFIERIGGHFQQAAEAVITEPDVLVADIPIITLAEKEEILLHFNATSKDYPRNQSIPELFAAQVDIHPQANAILWHNGQLTYRELDEASNKVAAALWKRGVKKGNTIGLLADRSAVAVIGMLGILKGGCAYVPIDPNYPSTRIEYMIHDSNISYMILAADREDLSFAGESLSVKTIIADELEYVPNESFSNLAEAQHLAYTMYTSGTTGVPKGVMISHRNIVRLVRNIDYATLQAGDRLLQTGAAVFDASTFEVWGTLLNGMTLCLTDEETLLDAGRLEDAIRDYEITTMWLTSPLFNQLSQERPGMFRSMKQLLVGGDALSPVHINRVRRECPQLAIINGYGPTENTTFSVCGLVDKEYARNIPIGRPITNSSAYIMDRLGRLVPIGVPGELCVGGDGVGKGYLNREQLTAEHFTPDPFCSDKMMYRTGDLARWLTDGRIEYLGRIDQQVKIRGFRIEPGEIETRMLKHSTVKEAVVMVRTKAVSSEPSANDKYLCAYYAGWEEVTAAKWREWLAESLPDYMIPSAFVKLEQLPLTPNGKVDKTALPEPPEGSGSHLSYEEPTSKTELELAAIWQEVLGVARIGRGDSFFDLGGHSLKATQLIQLIHKRMQVRLPLRLVFQTPTLSQMAGLLEKGNIEQLRTIPLAEKRECYPVSSAQKRMLMLQKFESAQAAYNVPNVYELKGPLQANKLEEAIRRLIVHHEALRTSFPLFNGVPVQQIHSDVPFSLLVHHANEQEVEERVQAFIRPFDLNAAPLMRAELLLIGEHRHVLMIDMHHIITDGMSQSLFMDQLVACYEGKELVTERLHYKDYAVWEQEWLQSEDMFKAEQFWLQRFSGSMPVLELPYDETRPLTYRFEGDRLTFQLSESLSAYIRKRSADAGTTLFMILLSAYHVLLAKLSGQEDIIVGSPIAGRSHPDLETVIGMFVNTLAFRLYPNAEKSFSSFLEEAREHIMEAFEHQQLPFEYVIEKLSLKRDVSRNALFDTMFVLQNMNRGTGIAEKLSVEPYAFDHPVAKFDLTLSAIENDQDGTIGFSLEYSTKLFHRETVERFAGYYTRILEQIASNPDVQLQHIELISAEEKHSLLYGWNQTAANYPREKTIHGIFEEQAAAWGDRVALIHESTRMTYQELNGKANALAHRLRTNGIARGSIIAVMMERSADMVMTLLAVLKAGGAYLPIDPTYPLERVQFMLEDSGAAWLLADEWRVVPATFTGQVLTLNGDYFASNHHLNDRNQSRDQEVATNAIVYANLDSINEPTDVAYIIYTSGTTGKPKGAMLEHGNVVRLVHNERNVFAFNERDVWTMFHSYCFDFSVWEMYGALLYGGTLVVVPKETAINPKAFLQLLAAESVTVLNQTPTAFYHLLQEDARHKRQLALKYVIFGGEALNPLQLKPFHTRYPETKLINMYGITETTVHVTYKEITQTEIEGNSANIGTPLPTLTAYVLDNQLKPVPIGVTGELFVGGEGVCRGYLNRPELTAERFLNSPFVPGERLYKSGDLAKRLPQGELVYMGRIDHQVKIRGHRIELAEVEAALLRHEGLQEAVVVARKDEDGQAYLCAYYTTAARIERSASVLRNDLKSVVPDYMVPSYFIQLDAVPLTSNGKVNRNALPEPQAYTLTVAAYVDPRNEIEEVLVAIWQDVLDTERIGIEDDFFELGGDSIKAIQVSARLHGYGYSMEMKDLFRLRTIGLLSDYVTLNVKQIEQGIVEGEIPLTPIQHWFFSQQFTDAHHYNQSVMLYDPEGFDEKILHRVFRELVLHHDALRIVYKSNGSKSIQLNRGADGSLCELLIYDLCDRINPSDEIEQLAGRVQSSLNIEQGPLVKLGWFKTAEGDHLLIVVHHLVVDGVSWRILLEDLKLGLEQAGRGDEIMFQPKTHSFRDYAQQLMIYARSRKALKERDYWLQVEQAEIIPLTGGNSAKTRGSRKIAETAFLELSTQDTDTLLKRVHRAYNTEINDVLLTALGLTFQRWKSMDQIKINLEGHGREQILDGMDITRTVGWFTTMYPVIIDTHVPMPCNQDEKLSYAIKRVKDNLRRIPNKGIGYGILAYLSDGHLLPAGRTRVLPEISFNYLGQFDQDVQGRGLSVSSLSMGHSLSPEMERAYALDINGMVSGGQLTLSFNYHPEQFSELEINQLITMYKEQLLLVIEHCVSKEDSELTASDFTGKDMSLEELGDIEDIIRLL